MRRESAHVWWAEDASEVRAVLAADDIFSLELRQLDQSRPNLLSREEGPWSDLRGVVWRYLAHVPLGPGHQAKLLHELKEMDGEAFSDVRASMVMFRAFGRDIDRYALEAPLAPAFRAVMHHVGATESTSALVRRAGLRRYRRAVARWLDALGWSLNQHAEDTETWHSGRSRRQEDPGQSPADLVDRLLGAECQGVTDLHIAQAISLMMFNLGQVSGAALQWSVWALAARPDLCDWVTDDDADSQHRAWAVAQEILRHAPMVTVLARRNVSSGVHCHVPPGAHALVNIGGRHHDVDLWREDPSIFRPSRWLGDSRPHSPLGFLPYGMGPRTCTGAKFADRVLVQCVQQICALKPRLVATPQVRTGPVGRPAGIRVRWSP